MQLEVGMKLYERGRNGRREYDDDSLSETTADELI